MAATGGPNSLQTLTDIELQNLEGGPPMEARAAAEMAKRAAATGARRPTQADLDAFSLTWGDLKQRHPEFLGSFWEECRALYAGGHRLFGNGKIVESLFPKNMFEDPEVYKERVKRAHYFPYPGTILDSLVAGLSSDPLRVSFAEENPEDGTRTLDAAAEWWEQFVGDVKNEAESLQGLDYEAALSDQSEEDSRAEGGCSAHEFMLEVAREAEQTRTAWILCELPEIDDEESEQVDSVAAAEQLGMVDPYLCIIPAEHVIDWHEDARKELEWVLVRTERTLRPTLRSRRDTVEQTYTIWTRTGYLRYVVIFDPKKPPDDNQEIKVTKVGDHPFGVVPFVRFTLPEGMWGMGKLHSLAREHFNKRCAMAWAEYKSLFPMLYEYLGAEDSNGMPIAQAQQDAGRAVNQVRAIGWTQIRGKDDRAEFVGPAADAFNSARESCNDLMREMHRVMFSMGLSANMDSAALQRSGDSKAQDKAATEVLLDALGVLIRGCFRRCLALVARGRAERVPSYTCGGLEHFDAQGVLDAINEMVLLLSVGPIKSATAAELLYSRLYAKVLGEGATQEQLENIRSEVAEQVSAEQILAEAMNEAGKATADHTAANPGGDPEEEPPVKPPSKGKQPMYSSKKPR